MSVCSEESGRIVLPGIPALMPPRWPDELSFIEKSVTGLVFRTPPVCAALPFVLMVLQGALQRHIFNLSSTQELLPCNLSDIRTP